MDAAKAVGGVKGRAGIALAERQWEAIELALRSKALVITGGLCVGKTSINRKERTSAPIQWRCLRANLQVKIRWRK